MLRPTQLTQLWERELKVSCKALQLRADTALFVSAGLWEHRDGGEPSNETVATVALQGTPGSLWKILF